MLIHHILVASHVHKDGKAKTKLFNNRNNTCQVGAAYNECRLKSRNVYIEFKLKLTINFFGGQGQEFICFMFERTKSQMKLKILCMFP